MIDANTLLNNDYKHYPAFIPPTKSEFCKGLFQRILRDSNNICKYAINFYQWKFPKRLGLATNCWSVEVHFITNNDEFDINLLIYDNRTLESVEAFYANSYAAFNCITTNDKQQ